MPSGLIEPAKDWPENMRGGRDRPVNEGRYPPKGRPTFLLPLHPRQPGAGVKRNYVLYLLFAFFVGLYPSIFVYLVGAFSLVENLLSSFIFGLGIFLWSFPGWSCRSPGPWLGCLTASLIALGLAGALTEPYLLCIVFVVLFVVAANNLLLHGVAIRAAAPVSLGRRKKLISLYKTRFRQLNPPASVHLFLLPVGILGLSYIVWQWPWLQEARELIPPKVFVLCMLAFVWMIPLFIEISVQLSGGPHKRMSVFAPYRSGLRTIHSWLTYNLHGSSNPTGFLSPSGSWQRRGRLLAAALIFINPIANPSFLNNLGYIRTEQLRASVSMLARDLMEKAHVQGLPRERTVFLGPGRSAQTFDTLDSNALTYLEENPDHGRINRDGSVTIFPGRIPRPDGVISQELAGDYWTAQEQAILARIDKSRSAKVTSMPTYLALFGALASILALVSCFLPLLLLVGLLVATTGRAFAVLDAQGYNISTSQVYKTENWAALVKRLRDSSDATERDSILLGTCQVDGSPILLPRSALREHVHFLGSTGSGKTALGLGPLVSQLMDFDDCSVIVIDLKGDDSFLFEELSQGQKKRGTGELKYFTPERDRGSYAFNLFKQPMWERLSVVEKTDLLTTGLGLFYGTDYGRKYYSDSNFALIEAAIRECPDFDSFAKLRGIISSDLGLRKEILRDSSNSRMIIERLCRLNVLNVESTFCPQRDLDLESLFVTPQAWFLSMPTSVGSTMNADIARLISFSMLAAAKYAPKPRRQVYLVIDEFQRMLSSNLEIVLQLARSHDISVILANQSISDLNMVGTNLVSAVTNNTRIRQYFAATGQEDIETVMRTSGEYLVQDFRASSAGYFFGAFVNNLTLSNVPSPRIRVNDILAASDEPNSSIFFLRSGAGYAQFSGLPVIAQSVFHIDEREYRRRSNSQWPSTSQSPYTVADIALPTKKDKSMSPPADNSPITTVAATEADKNELDQLLAKLDQESNAASPRAEGLDNTPPSPDSSSVPSPKTP